MLNLFSAFFAVILLGLQSAYASSGPIAVTILHTNDLHSHFAPENTPLSLGGIARLKTAIDRERRLNPSALLVDGGDWSEGDIYYTEGAGREVLKTIDLMGYDIAAIGNHDWLNGPDTLLDAIDAAQPHVTLLAANFDTSRYPRRDEFKKKILPFVVKNINGAKVAFIGLATYEFIFDKYIEPIKISEPFGLTRELAKKLKKIVDAVVVISHNRVAYNQALLRAAPDVDLVIGAHDHVKLSKPVIVSRFGAPAGWVVEAGCWGRYLGRVDMKIVPREGDKPSSVELSNYYLTQIDRTIPEDPAVATRVERLKTAIEKRMGPVFSDHIADSEVELPRDGLNSNLGNFVTDAYRETTGADLALDMRPFVYDPIHEGRINTVDIFNSNSAVYNPRTGKTWTLKTLPISGRSLSWIFKLLLFKSAPAANAFYSSGVNIVFDGPAKPALPLNSTEAGLLGIGTGPGEIQDSTAVRSILIGGRPLDEDKTYLLAAGGGIFESIQTLNSVLPNLIPTGGLEDTGIESWAAEANYIRALSPLTPEKVSAANRIQTLRSDLGVEYDDVKWIPIRSENEAVLARVSVTVHNFGASPSPESGPYLLIAENNFGNNLALDPEYRPLTDPIAIGSLAPGESRRYEAVLKLLPDRGVYSINALIRGNETEFNHSNDQATRYFSSPSVRP